MLNLPTQFKNQKTLYVGVGGGYDILGAIPIQTTLKTTAPIYANLGEEEYDLGGEFVALPKKAGTPELLSIFQGIVDSKGIKQIVALDGGVDVLMRGDEYNGGTVLQDFITLAALQRVKCASKLLACVGFGCELEEDLNHYRVLENIATLTQSAGFIGSCSMLPSQSSFQTYKATCERVWTGRRQSHIHSRVIKAVEGHFGDVDMPVDPNLLFTKPASKNFINPLMAIYWCFNLDAVADQNHMIPHLADKPTLSDAFKAFRGVRVKMRDKQALPL